MYVFEYIDIFVMEWLQRVKAGVSKRLKEAQEAKTKKLTGLQESVQIRSWIQLSWRNCVGWVKPLQGHRVEREAIELSSTSEREGQNSVQMKEWLVGWQVKMGKHKDGPKEIWVESVNSKTKPSWSPWSSWKFCTWTSWVSITAIHCTNCIHLEVERNKFRGQFETLPLYKVLVVNLPLVFVSSRNPGFLAKFAVTGMCFLLKSWP